MNHTPMTVRGAEKLRQELDYLKSEAAQAVMLEAGVFPQP